MSGAARLFRLLDLDSAIAVDVGGARVALYSRRAPGKDTPNEDAALVLEHPGGTVIAAVADGVGGLAAGETASGLAVERLATAFAELGDAPVRAGVLNGFEQAHAAIRDTVSGAATTLAALELNARHLRSYHAGDSGLVVVGGRGKVKFASLPHSPTGYGVEAGLLDAADALHHEERHVVSNVLGHEPMSVEMGSPMSLAARDTVVLASDGLFDNLYVEEIGRLATHGDVVAACQVLADRALARMATPGSGKPSKLDDLTILVLRPPS